ncbi:MAG: carbohydrate ABC transporter permease [Clostridia bacterium]|nr:carbohydrate ABC transporter permease [Clostridia bacterium]
MNVATKKNRLFRKKKLADNTPIAVKIFSYICITLFAVSCVVPVLMCISASFSDEEALAINGYTLIPVKFSIEGYKYIFENPTQIFRSVGVSVFSVVATVILGVIIMSMFAYAITRPQFPWRKKFQFFGFLPTLLPGSAVATYIVNTQWYGLRDNIWVFVFLGAVSMFHILILSTYFRTSIPHEVIESATIDGAGELSCCFKIAFPMAVPVMATIALFITVAQWNDVNTPLLYIIKREDLVPLQLLLNRIESNIQFLTQMESTGALSASDLSQTRNAIPTESFKMALTVVAILPMLVSYPFFQQFFISGMTVGSIK